MRTEKQFITNEYVSRLNSSPFFIVVDYRGLTVTNFTELRKRLRGAGSEMHVVKNSIFRVAAKEAGVADLSGTLAGQLAVVTGQKDVSAAAKILKGFTKEFSKGNVQFGYLKSQRLEGKDLMELADLPSIEVLRSKILGLFQAPAAQLVRMINAPGAQLARVIQARVDKEQPKS
ncbi:MAG TPA: 50S ribosomal protein L10 [Verrucomicrobiae bacterium]|nr:50S ribosomal protein L10 [Verrucomicrobiae bacterium]